MSKELNLIEIKNSINKQIADRETFTTLCETTFKGLTPQKAKQAMLEGLMRGFKFEDFLKKDVYAVPFKGNYSLVTSIDHNRKIGMRSGVVGKEKPEYEYKEDGTVESCTVTVKKQAKESNYIGDYIATVFFDEYYSGHKNPDGSIRVNQYGQVKPTLWDTKPRTMIAKVAEMHALRMACPEELSNSYIEEDYSQEIEVVDDKISQEVRDKIASAEDVKTLNEIYKENEGLGKAFAELITNRQAVLKNENS